MPRYRAYLIDGDDQPAGGDVDGAPDWRSAWTRAHSPPEPSPLGRTRTIMGRATVITITPQPTTTDPRRTPITAGLPLLVVER